MEKTKGTRTNKREKLIEEAVKLFLKKGYAGTTMKDLGKAAGVQAPAIYYHFKSKKDLLDQLNEDGWKQFHAMILDPAEQIKDPVERIKLFVSAMISYQLQLGKKTLVIDDSLVIKKNARRKAQEREVIHFLRDCLREITEGQDQQLSIDPTLAAFSLHYMVGRVHKWFKPKGQISVTELGEQIVRLFLYGFMGKSSEGPSSESERK
jgi:TetR/AcrR family transcriptional regulator, cholesterol catabolism regulator